MVDQQAVPMGPSEQGVIAQNWRNSQQERLTQKEKKRPNREARDKTREKPLPDTDRKPPLCRHHFSRVRGSIGR